MVIGIWKKRILGSISITMDIDKILCKITYKFINVHQYYPPTKQAIRIYKKKWHNYPSCTCMDGTKTLNCFVLVEVLGY